MFGCRFAGEQREVSARELCFGGSALLSAAAFDFATGAAGTGLVASGSGHRSLLSVG